LEEEMESKNRNWVIILIVVLVVACLCMVLLTVAGAGWALLRVERSTSFDLDFGEEGRHRAERTYEVDEPLFVVVKNFAGTVIVRRGESDELRLATTKKARSRNDLDKIKLEVNRRNGNFEIETKTAARMNNATVELELTVPERTSLEVRTGAGTVDVRGLTGLVDIECGAGTVLLRDIQGETGVDLGSGTIDAQAVTGNVHMSTGAGTINYEGEPMGDCRFESGAGAIALRLPEELNMEVDLKTAIGEVEVEYRVDGDISKRRVRGVVGTGSEGSIRAHTGVGAVSVEAR
jgi:DUF4097 and DUF4098 domain-containing protein YvlB